jgi:CBS-domain-containing membrane protein
MTNTTSQPASTVTSASTSTPRRSSPPRSPSTPQVTDIMTRTVVTATADTPLPELIDEVVRYGISGIPIVDSESRLVGIVTEADLMSKPAFGGTHRRSLAVIGDLLRGHERRWVSKSTGVTAGEIMTTEVETARPFDSVRAAARQMVERGVKRLPVVYNGRLVGIVSRTDVLRKMHLSDADLQAEIAAVFADPARVPETAMVDVSVADGVVTLRGTVRFPIDLPVLSAIVWRFPGVVDVRVEATPREPNPQPTPRHSSDYDYLRYMG